MVPLASSGLAIAVSRQLMRLQRHIVVLLFYIGRWCNGSTHGSGPWNLGSNPGLPGLTFDWQFFRVVKTSPSALMKIEFSFQSGAGAVALMRNYCAVRVQEKLSTALAVCEQISNLHENPILLSVAEKRKFQLEVVQKFWSLRLVCWIHKPHLQIFLCWSNQFQSESFQEKGRL